MPDNTQEEKTFINEKIVKKSRRGQILKKILKTVFLAALFGIVATCAHLVSKPYLSRFLVKEETIVPDPITIPREELETEVETTRVPESETIEPTEPVEDIVASAIESLEYSYRDLDAMYKDLTRLATTLDTSIVSVHSVKNETDWFNNTLETQGYYAGALIATNETQMLILTTSRAVEGADELRVTFSDGEDVIASVKKVDMTSSLAVLSIELDDVTESKRALVPLVLGNSYQLKRGDLVLTMGAPAGVVRSVEITNIAYISGNISVTDGYVKEIYLDDHVVFDEGSFIVNIDGEIVGWIMRDSSESMSIAYGISDLKSIIETLSNASAYPYVGIMASAILDATKSEDMPVGIYVTDVIAGSPAYEAGIQAGDILSDIGESKISNMNDLRNALERLAVGDEVEFIIWRYGREEYKDLTFGLKIGTRP